MSHMDYENKIFSEKVFARVGKSLSGDIEKIKEKKYKDRSIQLRRYIVAGVEADKKELNL